MKEEILKSISKSDKVKFLTKLASGKFELSETQKSRLISTEGNLESLLISSDPLKNLSDEDLDKRINELEQILISQGERDWVSDIKKQLHIS